ncbi:MAG: protein kinase [Labilithrix sp.]|nr:protein kinase [Labilithrix sp.]MCW5812869.1 protein kinase [Labilithrix sp.]
MTIDMEDNAEPMEGSAPIGGRFVIESLAGTGGMGAVYRARDRVTGGLVALKVIAEQGSDRRFEQEARVLAQLDHPAVVGYVAHGSVRERAYIAMEWLDGEDLRARLAREPLSLADTLLVARRVAEALAAAHARGIVHRDVKPANLFLVDGAPSRLKVVDFGIARTRGGGAFDTTAVPITRTGLVIGSVGYMSPEQARGAKDVDARADVFALGCVLFECITGQPAFAGVNAVAVLAKVLLEEAPRTRHLAPSVPPAIDELVARMLAKDPDARPRDAATVLRALEASETSRSSGSGVGDREQRMVTIVLARGVAAGAAPVAGAIPLAADAFLVEFRGHDPTTAAAACALSLAREHAGASLAIATGRVGDAHAGAYGPIIDRVATLAPRPRGIPIDDVSAALLGDRFEIEDGALLGPARSETAPRTLLGKRTPYVGRDKELALLEATFRECLGEPVARSVVVTAAAGGGKSRLAHELLARVRGEATVLVARGDPVGAGSALGLARRLVQSAAGVRDDDAAEVQHATLRAYLDRFFADEVLDHTAEMLGELVGAPAPSPSPQLRGARDDARALGIWIAKSFAEWIAAAVEAGPIVCVIEDLHWGDGASVAYLDEALRANEARPLMVLALARPEVHDLFPGLWSRCAVQEVKLSALTKRAAERLIRAVLPDLDDAGVAHIVERSGGNAFHLEELIRHVAERGWGSLPETVLALAEARIARLDPDARRFLRVASVFGETFSEPGVTALLDGEAAAGDALQRLVVEELVVPAPSRGLAREHRFRHGLLRDATYAMLADDDRTALHGRAGAWLEEAGEKDALVLAEHFDRAGDRARAAPCFLDAAQRAVESWNIGAARALSERGVHCGATGELLGRLRLVQAIVDAGSGAHASAARAAKEAYALVPPRSSHSYAAAAHALSSGAYVGDNEAAPEIIQMLLTTDPDVQLTGFYGFAISLAVEILDSVGQLEAAERLVEHAERAAASDASRAFRVFVRYARVAMMLRRDADLGVMIESAKEARRELETIPDRIAIGLFDYGTAVLFGEAGDSRRARSLFFKLQRDIGEAPLFSAWCAIQLGWLDVFEERYDDAIAQARRAFALDPHHAHALAAYAHLEKGDRSEAERLAARALEGIDDKLVTPFVVALAYAAASRVALAAGRLDDALRLVVRAEATSFGAPPMTRSFVARTSIDVARARGEDARERIDAFVARIARHERSLPEELRAGYRRHDDHRHVLELAQR